MQAALAWWPTSVPGPTDSCIGPPSDKPSARGAGEECRHADRAGGAQFVCVPGAGGTETE